MSIRGLCHQFCKGEYFYFQQFPLEISDSQGNSPAETGLAKFEGQDSAFPDTEYPVPWPWECVIYVLAFSEELQV